MVGGVGRGELHALTGELRVEVSGVGVAHHLGLEGRRDALLVQLRPVNRVEKGVSFDSPAAQELPNRPSNIRNRNI